MPAPSPGLNFVPRWRTMISPPVTFWPANTLTPRRLGLESRPLRLEPRPFLCAIGRRLLLRLLGAGRALGLTADRGHPDAGELLAVARAALVAALGLELEHAQLGAANVADHLRLDDDAVEIAAELGIAVTRDQQRLQIDRVTLVRTQPLDEQGRALLDAVLLAAGPDDCVGHGFAHSLTSDVSGASAPAFARERRRPRPPRLARASAPPRLCGRGAEAWSLTRRRRRRSRRPRRRSAPPGRSRPRARRPRSAPRPPPRPPRAGRCRHRRPSCGRGSGPAAWARPPRPPPCCGRACARPCGCAPGARGPARARRPPPRPPRPRCRSARRARSCAPPPRSVRASCRPRRRSR